jgi:uncharacterized OB-fold protein
VNTPAPPGRRSTAGTALLGLPVDGALRLQRCGECGAVQYPPRETCGACLADTLRVERVTQGATVLAATVLHHSLEPWFAARLPWTVASVALDAGPVAFVHIDASIATHGTRVRVATAQDGAGAWCLVAFADDGSDAADALHRVMEQLGMKP